MKKTIILLLGFILPLLLLMFSCKDVASQNVTLKNAVDSLSYAQGVSIADQGLMQFMEQMGVLENTSNVQYEYQMKISSADSLDKIALEKELKGKVDSLNRINEPRMREFINGLKSGLKLEEKSAYGTGYSVGTQFSQQMVPQFNQMIANIDSTYKIDKNLFLYGLVSALRNKELAVSKLDAGNVVQTMMNKAQIAQQERQEEKLKEQYKDSIAAGNAFMEANGKRPEVHTLPSGLQYEVIKQGKGAVPTENDRVKVHYHGTLINGTVFDSSVDRGEPVLFGVTQVIPGWTEALKLMPVGSKWKLYVPYQLAYGSQDRGTIKPFSNLIFEVELLGIEKK